MEGFLERRKFIRLSSVFPVTLQFFLADQPKTRPYQGFTRNVSIDGLCIEISDLDTQAQEGLCNPQLKLQLSINMPLSSQPTLAQAEVVWTKSVESTLPKKYLVGVRYKNIDQKAQKRIFSYAKRVRNLPRYVTTLVVILFFITSYSLLREFKIRCVNRLLIEKTVQLAKSQSQLEHNIWLVNHKEQELQHKLSQSIAKQKEIEGQMLLLQEALEQTHKLQDQKLDDLLREKEQLQQTLNQIEIKKTWLESKLAQLLHEKGVLNKSLTKVEREGIGLRQSALQNMYSWLCAHQVGSTGLLISFEGDKSLENWAFTYDQSLGAQVFTLFGDYEKTRKIFDFYKHRAKKVNGGFVNAYEVEKGYVNEYTVHCGPNIWLAIAILQYTNKSQDTQYMDLVYAVADWIIDIQNQDREFGICGGPGLVWFSTEHNLDAYALFKMLDEISEQKQYQLAAQRTLEWLKNHAYNSSSPPINRGKGDATIATDTFSWAICSLGPETLFQDGMDPEQIIAYAEDNCAVMVKYQRPEGEVVEIKGFDFSKYRHLPRAGVVSTEWTAQMIVAYKIMADYFFHQNELEKTNLYAQKANFYLNELNKMLICSPCKTGQGQGCLPYATAAFVDTGHGWRTPRGDKTGSLAATAYTIFASIGYNPLSFFQPSREEERAKVSLSNFSHLE